MEALTVKNLFKSFENINALADVSFVVDVGERRAIIGPNGAGKTTLINVVSGVLPPTKGHIYAFGQDITRVPLHKRRHLGLSRSFQISSLFFELTILDNVLLALQGTQVSWHKALRLNAFSSDFVARARKLLEPVGFWEKKDVPTMALSNGEQRQLEIIITMVSGTRILLLDEPSAGLSTAESATLANIIRNLSRDVTVLFAAHDLDLVFSLAERITILHNGCIFTEGTPDEIHVDAKVREIYMGGGLSVGA